MIYEGDFKEGMRHGSGIWRESNSPNATTYEGLYFNDKKHGEGIYKWKSGSLYKGNFYNDQRDGYGEMFWIDGSSYKGQWEKGAQRGEGLMSYPDKEVKIIETNTSRNYSIGNNEFYNSKSFSQSDHKLPKHQQLISDVSSYSQDHQQQEFMQSQSDKKRGVKVKLINHNPALSTNNGRFRMERIDETIRETNTGYNNYMRVKDNNHRRIISKDYPRIPPVSQVVNNFDYESVADSGFPRTKTKGNQVLASTSHYTSQAMNRSLDMRKENRAPTGDKSYQSLSNRPLFKHNRSHDITTEPEAVIKILRRRGKKRGQKGKYFKIRSNSHNGRGLHHKYGNDTRNAYTGAYSNIKKKHLSELFVKNKLAHKYPWKPSGLRDALWNKF